MPTRGPGGRGRRGRRRGDSPLQGDACRSSMCCRTTTRRIPKPCYGGWGRYYLRRDAGRPNAFPVMARPTSPRCASTACATAPSSGSGNSRRAFQAFRGDEWMKEPCRTCPRKSGRLRRVPLPGFCADGRCRERRPGLHVDPAPRASSIRRCADANATPPFRYRSLVRAERCERAGRRRDGWPRTRLRIIRALDALISSSRQVPSWDSWAQTAQGRPRPCLLLDAAEAVARRRAHFRPGCRPRARRDSPPSWAGVPGGHGRSVADRPREPSICRGAIGLDRRSARGHGRRSSARAWPPCRPSRPGTLRRLAAGHRHRARNGARPEPADPRRADGRARP